MWKIIFTYRGITRVHYFESISEQYELYGYCWTEDYINEELFDVLENVLGILDDVNADNGEYLKYEVYDENGKSFDDYEC